MLKKKTMYRIVAIVLIITACVVTDRVRYNEGKRPIFAIPFNVSDATIYHGLFYDVVFGCKGNQITSEWDWFGILF
jgi:hypothetical protein